MARISPFCRRTGKIYWRSEFSYLDELNDELLDNVEDGEQYAAIPETRVWSRQANGARFTRESLPNDFDEVIHIQQERRLPKISSLTDK